MEWLFGAEEGTSTGTSGEAEEAEKKRLKVERQAERRHETLGPLCDGWHKMLTCLASCANRHKALTRV